MYRSRWKRRQLGRVWQKRSRVCESDNETDRESNKQRDRGRDGEKV